MVCWPASGGEFTLWSATQIPHVLRVMLALVTGIPEQNIRVIAPDVGGGFGSKLQVTAEEVLAVLIARKLGRPVKWTESRSEGNMTVHHGRDQWQRIKIAADRDGRLRGLSVDLLADMGAYLMLVTPGVPLLGAFMYHAIYKMDALLVPVHRRVHHQDADRRLPRRRPAGGHVRHRADHGRARRRAGHGPAGDQASGTGSSTRSSRTPRSAGLTYDSGNYEAATARAKELFGYDALRAEQEQRRAAGDPVQLGIGISTFTEMCGLAPSRVLGSLAYGAGGWEQASIRMLPTGKVEVVTGSSAARPGPRDGVEPDRRRPARRAVRGHPGAARRHPDLAARAWTPTGPARWPSAAWRWSSACDKVDREGQGRSRAHMLEAPPDDLEFTDGVFRSAATPAWPRPSRRSRSPRSPRTTCPTASSRARRRRHLRPGQLLVPARHAPVRDRGRHRDRRASRSAPTWPSTTSARSSTR